MDALEKEITAKIAEILEMEEDELWEKRDMHFFEELELDSLLALEIIASIEKKYKIEIEESRLSEITSLNKTITLIRDLISIKSQS